MEIDLGQKYLQPIQQLALHKQPYNINDVEFFCHQSYYEGQLLNGVDLNIKEIKGLNPNVNLIDYLPDSQQIIFSASSSLVLYNTLKKTFQQLLCLTGNILILKVLFDKTNNREYVIWVEKQFIVRQDPQVQYKETLKKTNLPKIKRQQSLNKQPKNQQNDFFKNMLGTFINQNNASNINLNEGILNPREKKVRFESNFVYTLKVFDFAKKQIFFNKKIDVAQNQTIKQVFLFYGDLKVVGYIIQPSDRATTRQIYYAKFQKKQLNGNDPQSNFSMIETSLKIENLKFNNQQSTYVFHDKKDLYRFYPQQQNVQSKTLNSFEQFLNISHSLLSPKARPLEMIIQEYVKFQSQILSITINEYVAILLSDKIYFHSAFEMQSLIFVHEIQQKQLIPSVIEFNKSTLLMSYKNSSKLTTYAIKNKSLKVFGTTTLQIQHCQQILKIFCNNISSQIFCVILFYQLESRYNLKSLDKHQETVLQYITKPAFIDICRSFLSPSSKTEAKILHVAKQKFKKIHTCPWLSKYLIETESSIYFGEWRQNFDNKKCVCLHPTGIFLVICFKESFKIYIITFEGLVNTYRGDSITDIQACAISVQGNHLAIGSASLITVYDFYSCNKIKIINLPIGTYIDSMEYMAFQLCCSFRSKKFYIYDSINSYKELIAFNPKTFISDQSSEEQSSIAYNLTFQLFNLISIYSVFYDPVLQIIIFSAKNNLYFYNCLTNLIMLNIEMDNITCFHYCQNLKTLFLGTENGEILSFAWPNKPLNFAKNEKKLKLHGGNITSISVSSDLKYLITIADDNSLCICYLTFVQNLKRIEGLQLIQFLFNTIRISFDILSRKGFYQFTHSKFNQKMDILKDYEDQNLNINFILPQQRTKQKEQMITNINETTIELINTNDVKYQEISKLVGDAKQQLRETELKRDRQITSMKKQLFHDYLAQYDTTQANQKLLDQLKIKFRQEIKKQHKQIQRQLQSQRANYRRELVKLQNKFKSQQKQLPPYFGQQLELIQQQKKEFIEQNIDCLSNLLNDYQNKNGTLACKNNNIQKEILLLKKKMQEHNYLLQRLQMATGILAAEQQQYHYCKTQKQQRISKEDKINLTQIQKEYVKQTQVLIQKDKQISILIENYEKQKTTLIYLEKCVQALENSIEGVVQNILTEKKQRKQLIKKIDQSGHLIKGNNNRVLQEKKEKVLIKNSVNGFIHNLAAVAEQVITKTQSNVVELLQKSKLLNAQDIIIPDKKQEQKQMLQKIIEAKLNAIGDSNERNPNPRLSQAKLKKYFKSKTQEKQEFNSFSHRFGAKNQFSPQTCREGTQNKRKRVILQQKSQKKMYQRIKTDQVVYQNRINKRNVQNQDLLQNYNSLAMDLYKTCSSLKRQQSLNRITIKKINYNKYIEHPLTPYQKYIQNKVNQQTTRKHKILGQVFQL